MADRQYFEKLMKSLIKGMVDYMTAYDEDTEPFDAYSQADVDACEYIINEYLQALLNRSLSDDEILSEVEIAVKKLNTLNEKCGYQLIETDQREEICKIIIEAARQVGYTFPPNDDDITYEWRNW